MNRKQWTLTLGLAFQAYLHSSIADNRTEEGRTKNRRVEIVKK